MIEIEIQNFQSIEKVAFRIEGFTALIGRSNIGKSATIRALKYALTGAAGTDFVRHGPECERRVKGNKKCKCKSVVSITTASMKLVWEKGDDDNQYTVTKDGKETVYTAVNRGTPDFLLPDFEPVKVGDSTDLLQVSDQFDNPFLLKESGSAVADVLSDVAKLDDINVAMKLVGKDRKNAVSTRNVRDKDIKQLTVELEGYEGLDKAVANAEAVEARYVAIEVLDTEVGQLDGFVGELQTLAVSIKALGKAVKPKLPDGGKLRKTGAAFVQLVKFYDEVAERGPVIRKLKGVDKVAVPDIGPVREALQTAEQFDGWLDRVRVLKQELSQSKKLDDLPEPAAGPSQEGLKALRAVGGLAARYEAVEASVSELEGRLAAVEAEEKELLDEFEALGVCPTCSLPVHPEHREAV
jgi:hypothetical protein